MRRLLIGVAVLALAGLLVGSGAATNKKPAHKAGHGAKSVYALKHFFGYSVLFRHFIVNKADIATQDGKGVAAEKGAKVLRTRHGVRIKMTMPTPEPDTYVYPTAAPDTPPIAPGWPEVFTGWAFIFNFPEKCNGPCDGDDLGDTPAQGGVANFAGEVIWRDTLELKGKLSKGMMLGNPPGLPGVEFQNPKGAEIHLAIAPHGQAIREHVATQTSAPAGNPMCACWWVAVVTPGGSGSHGG